MKKLVLVLSLLVSQLAFGLEDDSDTHMLAEALMSPQIAAKVKGFQQQSIGIQSIEVENYNEKMLHNLLLSAGFCGGKSGPGYYWPGKDRPGCQFHQV